MDRAIEIVKGMLEVCDKELDRLSKQYANTNPTNIYDASYREVLVKLKDTQIARFSVLREVKLALEEELKNDFREGFGEENADNE